MPTPLPCATLYCQGPSFKGRPKNALPRFKSAWLKSVSCSANTCLMPQTLGLCWLQQKMFQVFPKMCCKLPKRQQRQMVIRATNSRSRCLAICLSCNMRTAAVCVKNCTEPTPPVPRRSSPIPNSTTAHCCKKFCNCGKKKLLCSVTTTTRKFRLPAKWPSHLRRLWTSCAIWPKEPSPTPKKIWLRCVTLLAQS